MNNAPKMIYCSTLNETFTSINDVGRRLGIRRQDLLPMIAKVRKSAKGYEFDWFDPAKHPAPKS
ncbi:hypothetical protein UFOVP661_42 [uncultured Caudovirales phage]|uniref:Uncharacterized protein n=1 Tax=uncultured Caudovirales phage TaxID=2100421 RepID=A0A6J5NLU9_9CAUD|nr:hypothetical protein UFOVP661_42 [uncultured Caudovirales phage]